MLDIKLEEDGRVTLAGRLDASQVDKARSVLDGMTGPVTLDCSGLDYISSAGISVLLVTFKRVQDGGQAFRLSRLNDRVLNVLRYAGLDKVFPIE